MYHDERFNGYSHLFGSLLAIAGAVVLIVMGATIFYFYDERFKHWHGIWHLFVLGGSVLHYIAIFRYVA